MPTYPVPPVPYWADPNQTSVFDPLYQTLLKKAVGLSGLTDPTSGIMQSAIPTPLTAAVRPYQIGKLKNAGKAMIDQIKSAAALTESTNPLVAVGKHLREGTDAAPENLITALDYLQSKYPRMLGHIKDITPIATIRSRLANYAGYNSGFGEIGINVPNIEAARPLFYKKATPQDYLESISHEMLHAKDNLTIPGFFEKYADADKIHGYDKNPYELRANRQAASTVRKFTEKDYSPINKLLSQYWKGK